MKSWASSEAFPFCAKKEHATTETRLQALTALRYIGNMILWTGPSGLALHVRGISTVNLSVVFTILLGDRRILPVLISLPPSVRYVGFYGISYIMRAVHNLIRA